MSICFHDDAVYYFITIYCDCQAVSLFFSHKFAGGRLTAGCFILFVIFTGMNGTYFCV